MVKKPKAKQLSSKRLTKRKFVIRAIRQTRNKTHDGKGNHYSTRLSRFSAAFKIYYGQSPEKTIDAMIRDGDIYAVARAPADRKGGKASRFAVSFFGSFPDSQFPNDDPTLYLRDELPPWLLKKSPRSILKKILGS